MTGHLTVMSWVDIGDGCPIRFDISGSGKAKALCGPNPRDGFEFTFDSEALREFLRLGAEALHEMDAIHARERTTEADGIPKTPSKH